MAARKANSAAAKQAQAAKQQAGSEAGLDAAAEKQQQEIAAKQARMAAREEKLAEMARVAEAKKGSAEEKKQLAKRGYLLSEEQREVCEAQALKGVSIADVKRLLAEELVASGEWQASDATNGAELNEALYRAVRQVMRAAQAQAAQASAGAETGADEAEEVSAAA